MSDILCNLDEMAEKLDISLPTMRGLTKLDGFPIVERGRNGVPWQLNPDAVIAFVRDRRAQEAAGRLARSEALAQITLPDELLTPPELANLSTLDRYRVAQANRVELATAREAGHLVLKTDLRQQLRGAWASLMQGLLAMPSSMGRRHNLPAAVVADMRRYVEQQLRVTHGSMADLLPPEAEPVIATDAAA